MAKAFAAGRGLSLADEEISALRSLVEDRDLAHYETIKVYYEDDDEDAEDEGDDN